MGFHTLPESLPGLLSTPAARSALARLGILEQRADELREFVSKAASTAGDAVALAKELRRELHPEVVVNVSTGALHAARPGPRGASDHLVCGWVWAETPEAVPVRPGDEELDGQSWALCRRCAPELMRRAQEPEWAALASLPLHQGRGRPAQ